MNQEVEQEEVGNNYEQSNDGNDDIKYLAEGTFGCVFDTEIKCQTPHSFQNDKDKRKFVSKVTDKSEDREIANGVKIKTIKQYEYFFAPILDSCPINIGIIEDEEIKKCEVITKKEARQKNGDLPIIYVSNKMKFVGKETINEYLETKTGPTFKNQERKAIFETHLHLLKALNKLLLLPEPMIHFDLKGSNIMFDSKQNVPIIIDFGLSFTKMDIDNALLHPEKLSSFFYNDESYSPWPIEVRLISFIALNMTSYQDKNIDELFVQNYFNDFNGFVDEFTKSQSSDIIFDSEEEKTEFKDQMNEYFQSFKFKTIKELVHDLMQTWRTWDNYSISVMYKSYLDGADYLLKDPYITKYHTLLKNNILATPGIGPGSKRNDPVEFQNQIVELCLVNG
jgi:serine/threonine protein kinase